MIFEVPGAHFGYQNGVQNGVQNGISTLMALKSLLEGSWDALGAILAENVAWKLHGTGMDGHGTGMERDLPCALRRAVRRHAVG